jgi:hypothetical protein
MNRDTSGRPPRRGVTMLLIVGLAVLALGGGLGLFGARAAATEAARAERLPLLTFGGIAKAPGGLEAAVEGRISERNPRRFRDLVVYVREEYRGKDSDGDAEWREDERLTPQLILDLADGPVWINNESYRLANEPLRWQEPGPLVWNGITGEGTKRYRGFVAGAPATAIGRVARGLEGVVLEAEVLAGGSRAQYVASQRVASRIFAILGLVFAAIGAVLAFFGLRKVGRR